MLHPDFPIVDGTYQMTKTWSLNLPTQFNRRVEDGSLVIWRAGFTMWINIWKKNNALSPREQVESIKHEMSLNAYNIQEIENTCYRFGYRLDVEDDGTQQPAFYGFVSGESGHVQIAFYFDDKHDYQLAEDIWKSISEND